MKRTDLSGDLHSNVGGFHPCLIGAKQDDLDDLVHIALGQVEHLAAALIVYKLV